MTVDILGLERTLVKCLKTMGQKFDRDELAYYFLTAPLEAPIRDRLSFALEMEFSRNKLVVAREFDRIDIAILEQETGVPLALIEIKALYTFDILVKHDARYYYDLTRSDEIKASAKAEKLFPRTAPKIYSLMSIVHPHGPIPNIPKGVVKYSRDIAGCFKKFGSQNNIRELALEKMKVEFADRDTVSVGTVEAGHAFGVKVDAIWWLCRAHAEPALLDN